jgi:hypothetical protein
VIVTVISISHLSSPPLIPNVKCIAWDFDGSNFVRSKDKDKKLKRLRFENRRKIPNVESYFVTNDDSDDDSDDDNDGEYSDEDSDYDSDYDSDDDNDSYNYDKYLSK